MTGFTSGFLTGLGLIVAIGAQNVYVLRQGLRREHVLLVVVICALSDAVLIAAGVAGFGRLVEGSPMFTAMARGVGALYLFIFALVAAKRAVRPNAGGLRADTADTTIAETARRPKKVSTAPRMPNQRPRKKFPRPAAGSAAAVALATLGFTWLNPHVYLDTVVLLGTVATTKPLPWVFAAGAMVASIVWFSALGFGAARLAPLLATPRAWRILDAGIAATMFVMSFLVIRSGPVFAP